MEAEMQAKKEQEVVHTMLAEAKAVVRCFSV
jgi:hypothetical protein